ncbi:Hypothetical predicted protein [Paramuricea clavata]|uniref:Uncharacterized protein n=1 Tax=Paramuricea clavata TaxID=317549 RepID=A0A7D9E6V4_PARCT|nr:Hypothetical predicted protein [Paramuricea clavata]
MTRGDQEPPANARIHEDAEAADTDPPPAAPEIEPERLVEIPQDIPQRPARNRRPPSTLNYASLGNPICNIIHAGLCTYREEFNVHDALEDVSIENTNKRTY